MNGYHFDPDFFQVFSPSEADTRRPTLHCEHSRRTRGHCPGRPSASAISRSSMKQCLAQPGTFVTSHLFEPTQETLRLSHLPAALALCVNGSGLC